MKLVSYLYWLAKLYILNDKKKDVLIVLGVGSKNKMIRRKASSLLASKVSPVIQEIMNKTDSYY